MQTTIKNNIFLLTSVLLLSIALSACGGAGTADDTGSSGGTDATDGTVGTSDTGDMSGSGDTGGSSSLYNMPPLNDSGVLFGANHPLNTINLSCIGETIAEQDCSFGRDKEAMDGTLVKIGGGEAGFDFTKLGMDGTALTIQDQVWNNFGDEGAGTRWACVEDNHTGLIWEVKTNEEWRTGLHSRIDTFFWYNTDASTNGGNEGLDGIISGISVDSCTGHDADDSGTYCNTEAFVARVNTATLCGASDWRLPNMHELQTIYDYGKTIIPLLDFNYFPNFYSNNATPIPGVIIPGIVTWSSNSVSRLDFDIGLGLELHEAWAIDYFGSINEQRKDRTALTRLVRLAK